ncbi:uncharacterized protein LOC114007736 [Tupaia chinensis]|uniref:uncharacterized protein LOC114007736 n=1 Tax=Tupaia chinensis TaxID=246437 RepID=UPI000FFC03F4|nr:uncharacterized protein LOC114007736 [Tupaia chinensis]
MLLEGLVLLLNSNAAGARKQLLSCRHWQEEGPQMDFDSEPRSPPGLLVTKGLDPRLVVDLRAGAMGQLPSSGYGCSQAEAHVGGGGTSGELGARSGSFLHPSKEIETFGGTSW